jgi:predicted nucleic acid-binding protein
MTYLFDASSILQIMKSLDEQRAFRLLADSYILDLTKYEVGNAIWKQYALRHSIDEDQFHQLLELLGQVLQKVEVAAVDYRDLASVGRIAAKEKATFYDSSYVACSRKGNLTLVTEDSHLAKLAGKEVKVISSKQLVS